MNRITISTNTLWALGTMILFFYVNTVSDVFATRCGVTFFGVLCAYIAIYKNRNPVVWLALGTWFVFFSLILLLLLPHQRKVCPYCYNKMAGEAVICSYCYNNYLEAREYYVQ